MYVCVYIYIYICIYIHRYSYSSGTKHATSIDTPLPRLQSSEVLLQAQKLHVYEVAVY